MSYKGTKYIQCNCQCSPSFGQGDSVPYKMRWITLKQCLDNTQRIGQGVIEGSCGEEFECWKSDEQAIERCKRNKQMHCGYYKLQPYDGGNNLFYGCSFVTHVEEKAFYPECNVQCKKFKRIDPTINEQGGYR